jgi:hypothetical protein
LCQPDIAQAWVEHGRTPSFEQSREGEVPIIVIADERSALRQMAAYMRRQHGGKVYMGRRDLRETNAVRTGRLGQGR